MAKYRSKVVIVEAVQWFPLPEQPVEGVITPLTSKHAKTFGLRTADRHNHGIVETLEGPHLVRASDWIITGLEGEKYPCKDSVFQKKYELAEEEDTRDFSNIKAPIQTPEQIAEADEIDRLEREAIPVEIDLSPSGSEMLPEETKFEGEGGESGGGGASSSWEETASDSSDDRSASSNGSSDSSSSDCGGSSDSSSSDSSSSCDSSSSDSSSSSSDY